MQWQPAPRISGHGDRGCSISRCRLFHIWKSCIAPASTARQRIRPAAGRVWRSCSSIWRPGPHCVQSTWTCWSSWVTCGDRSASSRRRKTLTPVHKTPCRIWMTAGVKPSLGAGSPTSSKRAGNSTKPCASAPKNNYPSMNDSATCARAPSRKAKSPTSSKRAGNSTKPCASAPKKNYPSMNNSATCGSAPSRKARSPTSFKRAGNSTKPCASAPKNNYPSSTGSATCARAHHARQSRRHPRSARATRRSPAHPHRRTTTRL